MKLSYLINLVVWTILLNLILCNVGGQSQRQCNQSQADGAVAAELAVYNIKAVYYDL